MALLYMDTFSQTHSVFNSFQSISVLMSEGFVHNVVDNRACHLTEILSDEIFDLGEPKFLEKSVRWTIFF